MDDNTTNIGISALETAQEQDNTSTKQPVLNGRLTAAVVDGKAVLRIEFDPSEFLVCAKGHAFTGKDGKDGWTYGFSLEAAGQIGKDVWTISTPFKSRLLVDKNGRKLKRE